MIPTPRILVIAGSDSSGGAGIQADIKTITMLGGYAMTAVTALTAQNTRGVDRIDLTPPDSIAAQVDACLSDIGADVVKLGMLGGTAQIEAVAAALKDFVGPVVVDPVMVATSGDRLLPQAATTLLTEAIISRAAVVTPNIPELEILCGGAIGSADEAERAAARFAAERAVPVLVKGGHLSGDTLTDTVVLPGGRSRRFSSTRLDSTNTHGTGCTLASALATFIGFGDDLFTATEKACRFVRQAIERAPGFGGGQGPLGHYAVLRTGP